MAVPILLVLAAGAAGVYMLMTPSKKPAGALPPAGGATPSNPVVVPPSALPVPPGGIPADQMPGGPPTVVITPPTAAQPAQTPQQVITTALPNLLQNLPQLAAQAQQPAATPPAVVKEVPAPGQTPVSVPSAPAQATPDVQTPQQVLTQQLPTAVTQILSQAIPTAVSATPLQTAETHPELDPKGTIALAKLLIDREASANWKSANQAEVLAWQKRVGLTADGKFGEKGELRMAQEVGVLPLIRYWPANTLKGTEVPKYQAALRAYAASIQTSNPAHAIALNNAAAFEVGYAYDANPKPIPVSLRQGQADLLSQILKQ